MKHAETVAELAAKVRALQVMVESNKELTDAKFVTHSALLTAQAEQVALALTAAEKAISKAETATEKRFDAVNEFRGTLADQQQRFVSIDLFNSAFDQSRTDRGRLREDINSLRVGLGNLVTQEALDAAKSVAVVKGEDLSERIATLRNQQSRTAGIAIGISSAISLIAILLSIVLRLATSHG